MQVGIMLFLSPSPFFFFYFIKLDKSVINAIATNDESAKNRSLVKVWCVTESNVVSNTIN